jgi:multisubunit Na+/H+ antiporter MnhF subunit
MHQIIFFVTLVWATGLVGISVGSLVTAPSAIKRILVLDTLTLILVAVLALFTAAQRVPYYLDAALVLALLSFVGTLAAARYYGEGRVF